MDAMMEKKRMKNAIISSIKRDTLAKRDVLVASLQLEFGFNEETCQKMLENLEKIGVISIENDLISLKK